MFITAGRTMKSKYDPRVAVHLGLDYYGEIQSACTGAVLAELTTPLPHTITCRSCQDLAANPLYIFR